MLLHGLGATTALNFPGAFEALGTRFRVIGLDHRGHGGGLRARHPFTLDQAGSDVIAVADLLGVDRPVLVGYSMGGPVALHAIRARPDRVAGIVACATAARFDIGELAGTQLAPLLGSLRALPLRTRRRFVRLALPYLSDRTGIAADQLASLGGHDPAALWEALQELTRLDVRPWVGDLGVPAISLITRFDRVVPVARQEELAGLLAAHRIGVAGDHRVAATHPGAFLPALGQACDRLVQTERRRADS